MSFYTQNELVLLGLKRFGENVKISRKASIYGAQNISIGNHVRIDDFCILSAGAGGIEIGNFIHIAVFSSIIGQEQVKLDDYSNLSSRVSIYSSNDDYSGAAMTNPTIPKEFTNVRHAPVLIGKHVIIGSGSIILPGVTIMEGAAIGALSLVKKNCESFGVYTGNPAKKIMERKRDLLKIEVEFIKKIKLDDTSIHNRL
ncbi:MAG: galactoside O-acetyltransferase [Halothiobacillus sp. 24-54-40]|jgi:galactoside O-acetyltransferase|nr:MAG: galactoside O-acetyltransferase [Halothiobacillus sp. 20-53-49]OYY33297.1 MAG: galactoside O-acetyltransferase [Halothiobacillus sp. 35-54-62]OYZ87160.1 MAG: galactoside O-acetyltransferase [Halothiobacillus sp. 24-54-40]OZA79507.1 MAG: galactoside O-acetyltransferase [Halothiobacillus sp. 39-53-45]HQS02380.1 acyltransferase [Halothiobacillus sp.]